MPLGRTSSFVGLQGGCVFKSRRPLRRHPVAVALPHLGQASITAGGCVMGLRHVCCRCLGLGGALLLPLRGPMLWRRAACSCWLGSLEEAVYFHAASANTMLGREGQELGRLECSTASDEAVARLQFGGKEEVCV
jgi:hypothetical protein